MSKPTMKQEVEAVLHDPPNANRDVTEAVMDMLAFAFEAGRKAGRSDEVNNRVIHITPIHVTPNPYKEG